MCQAFFVRLAVMGSGTPAAFRRVARSKRLRPLLGAYFLFGLVEFGTWVAMLV